MDPNRPQARMRNNSAPSPMRTTSTSTPVQTPPPLTPVSSISSSTPRHNVFTPIQVPNTYAPTITRNMYAPVPIRNVQASLPIYTPTHNTYTSLPMHYQSYPIPGGFVNQNFGVAAVIPLQAGTRGRGRARRQTTAPQLPPQHQHQPYNSQLEHALTAASPIVSPPVGRRGRGSRGGGAASTRSRGGQRGARGARGARGGQHQQPVVSVSVSSQFSRLVFPVTDCCSREPSSSSGGRSQGATGRNHVDNPCIPCVDRRCAATAPSTEDLMDIPVEELVPRVEQVYNYIPGGLSGCNSVDELIDFSLYLGLSNDR